MFEDSVTRTELKSLGEFKLIDHITEDFTLNNKSSVYGVGDDCAVLSYPDKKVLVSTDLLVEGVHFDMVYTPLMHLGYKAAVVNFSDVYAMNGRPKQITVGIAVSNRFSVEAVKEIYAGIKQACKNYHVDMVGGDTTSSISGLFISITVIGEVDENNIVYRNGAQNNDLICVSGNLGAAYMGMLVLEREKETWKGNPNMQPDLAGNEYVLQRFLRPEARFDIVEILAAKDVIPTSMIDISDGLASELHHICKQSKKGCNIYEDKLPVDPATILAAEDFNINPITAAMNGGEDYELLFTIKQSDYEKIKSIPQISIIGHITDNEGILSLITKDNVTIDIKAQGWDSFTE
ncbi:MAG: thiamine-phosphate kinase [Bacteroidales bacterium]|nr:thiamine-phosphate kinase [Bacteroidales bacterium]MDD2203902.1 thiamine-phosphate kinase [Bacteroidales bacterium]MDD3913083.1 thiamine-phosphate kinase [Bacteroidales bacterium]MDD4632998.1 thiamine-phosphate kinase [Bacteroidales bacterium]